jgi:anti-sigma regulatory factor (Ser/Thr protein kinase)
VETLLNAEFRQTLFTVGELSEIASVRRAGSELARKLGFNEVMAGRVSLVITEAATNIVKHATRGKILLRAVVEDKVNGLEIIALDAGPGMASLSINMEDGVSSVGTYGVGLGAMRRLSSEFDVFTSPGMGTVVYMLIRADENAEPDSGWRIGAVTLPIEHEEECGDSWTVAATPGGLTLIVADGLGHGPDAATASRRVVEVAHGRQGLPPAALMQAAHLASRGTRGAATAIVQLDGSDQLRFAGVGNIAVCVIGAEGRRQHLVSHNGIVGGNMRKVQEYVAVWNEHSTLVMHSDGIGTKWNLDLYPGLEARHPALIAAVLYRDFARGRDDLTVVVLKEQRA